MILKKNLLKIYSFCVTQIGFDPFRLFKSIRNIPYFLRTYLQFKRDFKGKMNFSPSLQDRFEESGAVNSEYFWQDLLVAKWIFESNPSKHVDVGSRIDGFVAHVASYRQVEVIDVRPINSNIPNIFFKQGNMMDSEFLSRDNGFSKDYCDSLSCLHTIEHFGLGRYGDPIDPEGYIKGIVNMGSLIKQGGSFYLSTPIGKERVEFNSNWIFSPNNIVDTVTTLGFVLEAFHVYNKGGFKNLDIDKKVFYELEEEYYNLGIFVFRKS
jgi:hypothetical protein